MENPNIVHINENINASSVPYRQMVAFNGIGLKSTIITNRTLVDDSRIHVVYKTFLTKVLQKLDFVMSKIKEKQIDELKRNAPFSNFNVGYNLAKERAVKEADVIIIHWIGACFLSPHGIKKILELGKPVILVCHDNNHFTGGCHVRMGCENYKNGCGNCPLLTTKKKIDITSKLLEVKKKAYSQGRVVVVSPSRWMDENVKNSYALHDKEHYIIPNPININVFKPLDRTSIRDKYGINSEHCIVLFGAVNVAASPYKGYNELIKCLDILSNKYYEVGKIDVYVFGSSGNREQYSERVTINYLGYLDERAMVEAYNLADVYVVPSLEDSFNNTVAEALATETPVVSFAVGGIVDIMDHKKTGYLAKAFSPEDLADGIYWVLNNNANNRLGVNGRKKVIDNFSYEKVAEKYKQLFTKLK